MSREKSEGIRVSENGRSFRVSISFWKKKWTGSWEFYTNFTVLKNLWGRNKMGKSHNLWMAKCKNRRGRLLIFTKEKGEAVWRIFIPGGQQADGWWRMMMTLFELAERDL